MQRVELVLTEVARRGGYTTALALLLGAAWGLVLLEGGGVILDPRFWQWGGPAEVPPLPYWASFWQTLGNNLVVGVLAPWVLRGLRPWAPRVYYLVQALLTGLRLSPWGLPHGGWYFGWLIPILLLEYWGYELALRAVGDPDRTPQPRRLPWAVFVLAIAAGVEKVILEYI